MQNGEGIPPLSIVIIFQTFKFDIMNKLNRFLFLYSTFFIFLLFSCKPDKEEVIGTIFNPKLTYDTMSDMDGNTYRTITIGTQTWMAENLRVTRYSNGDEIPYITNDLYLKSGALCTYNNTTNIDTITKYGRLYNWYAVTDNRKISPNGWHVPTYAEWSVLTKYLRTIYGISGDYKTGSNDDLVYESLASTMYWKTDIDQNGGFGSYLSGNNESGFSALPSGYFHGGSGSNHFAEIGESCRWWSTTANNLSLDAEIYRLSLNNKVIYHNDMSKNYGYSVRLIKD